MNTLTIAIHGGAGTILQKNLSPAMEDSYRNGLTEALEAGYVILEKGGSAIDAVIASTKSLEDNILFNAGKGAVFSADGLQEMDAAIMNGQNLKAGAVAAVRSVRNPILLAKTIMDRSEHVFLHGGGALDFAKANHLAVEKDEYFFSEFRYQQWQEIKGTHQTALDHNVETSKNEDFSEPKKFGTVGAVAKDQSGNLAAATSTGGMTNKQFGRIGDSPLIGCGTYANNKTCAISCTGHGEPFIRAVTAYDVSCLMEYKNLPLDEAMRIVVFEKLPKLEAEGGMIGVDAEGHAALLFNSEGMYRGVKNNNGLAEIAIYKDQV